jgi:hypothetical protein
MHRKRSILRAEPSAPIAPLGHAAAQDRQPIQRSFQKSGSGDALMDSGLWHQKQLRGQPLRKAVVRIPGPSWVEYRWMSKIRPFTASLPM